MSDQPNTPETPVPPAKENPAPEAKFTQADVDRLVGERAVRAKESANKELLEALGVDSLDSLKTLVKGVKEREAADQTELQKASKALEDEKKRSDGYKSQIETMLAAQKIDRRNATIREAAQAERAEFPADTISWAEREAQIELAAVMAEDGTIDEKAVKALVLAHKKARPRAFLGGGVGSPSNTGGTPPNPDQKRIEEALANRKRISL